MWKAAFVVLAAGLILPMSISRAEAPISEEPVTQQQTPVRLPPSMFETAPATGWTVAAAPASGWVELRQSVTPDRERAWRTGPCLAADGEASNLCRFGAAISRAKPCLAAGDCPAYESWEQVMGTPGVEPAPEGRVRAAKRVLRHPAE